MGGADDTVFRVCKQDGAAIGGEHAENDAGRCRHHRIGFRPVAGIGGVDHHDVGGMYLVYGRQAVNRRTEPAGDAGTVFLHLPLVVIGAQPDIEAAIKTFGNTALAGEETVPDMPGTCQPVTDDRPWRSLILHVCRPRSCWRRR